MAILKNVIPATLNLENPSNTKGLNLTPNEPVDVKVDYALSNSFGFGGTNTALLFKSF